MARTTPSVLVFQGTSGLYIAHCLDYDFATQGKDVASAVRSFEHGYQARQEIAERRGERPFQRNLKASPEEWKRFESAKEWDGECRIATVRTLDS